MPRRFFTILALVFCLAACAGQPAKPRNALASGMSRRDVVLLMGAPDRVRATGTGEILIYRLHKDINQPEAPDEPYLVFTEGGKVTRFGPAREFPASDLESLEAKIEI